MKNLNKEKGITLIALIITIIVMLILVAVTVNVTLNGGLFTKAKEGAMKTELSQIQEALLVKKAEVIAENGGVVPENYGIDLDDLDVSQSLKTKYQSKLEISADGKLYYTSGTEEEIAYFTTAGIATQTNQNQGNNGNNGNNSTTLQLLQGFIGSAATSHIQGYNSEGGYYTLSDEGAENFKIYATQMGTAVVIDENNDAYVLHLDNYTYEVLNAYRQPEKETIQINNETLLTNLEDFLVKPVSYGEESTHYYPQLAYITGEPDYKNGLYMYCLNFGDDVDGVLMSNMEELNNKKISFNWGSFQANKVYVPTNFVGIVGGLSFNGGNNPGELETTTINNKSYYILNI